MSATRPAVPFRTSVVTPTAYRRPTSPHHTFTPHRYRRTSSRAPPHSPVPLSKPSPILVLCVVPVLVEDCPLALEFLDALERVWIDLLVRKKGGGLSCCNLEEEEEEQWRSGRSPLHEASSACCLRTPIWLPRSSSSSTSSRPGLSR